MGKWGRWSPTPFSHFPTMRRRFLIASSVILVILLVVAASTYAWGRAALSESLAVLDGQHRLSGLSGAVTVERDALGIPTIRGTSREDVARASGFLHAQDR